MKKIIIAGGIITFIIVSTIIFITKPSPKHYQESIPRYINVEVYGEVVYAGKYQVLEGTTLYELINYCQGFTIKANTNDLNLNEVLQDNYRYQIPSYETNELESFKYNLNEVNYNTLITIPNITETRAINILTYRQSIGKFNSVEELINVKGIGEVTFNKIKDYFYIR